MELNEYACKLGRIHGNLMSIETSIRFFLQNQVDRRQITLESNLLTVHPDYDSLKVGDCVPENAITDFKSLEALIDAFDRGVAEKYPDLKLDKALITLRDALAHGRAFTLDPKLPLLLVKFAKPVDGKVRVEFAEHVTDEKLLEWFNIVMENLRRVTVASERFGNDSPP